MRIEIVRQGLGAAGLHLEKAQSLDTLGKQGMRHGSAGPARAHLHHAPTGDVGQAPPKALGEAQAVGIVADALAILEYHGVHRPDATGFIRQLVKQRDDRLLGREGDVEAGKTHVLRGIEQARQGIEIQAELVQVDQPVEICLLYTSRCV